jgi:hypothetical protein
MSLSIVATSIALFVLLANTVFDLAFGKLYFDHQVKKGAPAQSAFTKTRKRRDVVTIAAMLLMSASLLLTLTSDFSEAEMEQTDQEKIARAIEEMGGRLKKVEDYLWPPTKGQRGPFNPTDPPPYDPSSLDLRIDELVRKIDAVGSETVSRKEYEELLREIAELRETITSYQETAEALQKMMAVPAG